MAVIESDGEGLDLGLTCSKILDGCGGDRIVPGDDAAQAVDGVSADARRQDAERARRGGGDVDAVRIG